MSEEEKAVITTKEICKGIDDFDNYTEVQLENVPTNISILKYDNISEGRQSFQRLLVNSKTQKYHHLAVSDAKMERVEGEEQTKEEHKKEEITLVINEVEFLSVKVKCEEGNAHSNKFTQTSQDAKNGSSSAKDHQVLKVDSKVTKDLDETCKWSGLEAGQYGELALKLGFDRRYSTLFDQASMKGGSGAKEFNKAFKSMRNAFKKLNFVF